MYRTKSDMNFNTDTDLNYRDQYNEKETKYNLYKELSKNLLNNDYRNAKKIMNTVNNLKVNSVINHIQNQSDYFENINKTSD